MAGETFLLLHLFFDELAFVMFGWTFVELIEPTATRISRSKWTVLGGFVGTLASSIIGDYYFSLHTKASALKEAGFEAQIIAMELKRHYLIVGSFLAVLALFLVWWKGEELMIHKNWRYGCLLLSGILAGVQFVMLTIDAVVVPLGWSI